MTTIEQLSQAAQQLTPAELRQRLDCLDQEQRILRALLRAALRGKPQSDSPKEQTTEAPAK